RPGFYRVKAQTEIADFNEMLLADLPLEDVDTLGGLVVRALGRVPKRGEKVNVGGFEFQVLRADSRRIHTLLVQRVLSADDEVLPQ
ncbi:MAG: transporter associated domain-containing protein, partial [Burkholderiales bacterium]